MHDQPITFILARRSAGAPDFSGPGLAEARRELMIEAKPEIPPDHADLPPDPAGQEEMHAKILDIAGQLREGADLNLNLADQLEEICKCLMGGAESPPELPAGTDEGVGQAHELE